MLQTGERAPGFELPDETGEPRTLAGLLAGGPVLLYFYPADFTPVCTAEACTFRDIHAELADAGLTVVGISPQSVESHAKFRQHLRLPFPLLADEDKRVIRAYGVDGLMGLSVRRVTYLIGADGVVLDLLRADLRVGRHEAFARRAREQIRR